MSDTTQNSKLGTCHACQGSVSKKAKVCPHCGEKRPYRPPTNWKKIMTYSGIFFGLYMFGQLIGTYSGKPEYRGSPSPQSEATLNSAIRKCEAGIMATVNNPSTVDIHRFTGFGSDVSPDGTRRITQTFSAKNGFGLEQTYDAYCAIKADGEFDIKIMEQGR